MASVSTLVLHLLQRPGGDRLRVATAVAGVKGMAYLLMLRPEYVGAAWYELGMAPTLGAVRQWMALNPAAYDLSIMPGLRLRVADSVHDSVMVEVENDVDAYEIPLQVEYEDGHCEEFVSMSHAVIECSDDYEDWPVGNCEGTGSVVELLQLQRSGRVGEKENPDPLVFHDGLSDVVSDGDTDCGSWQECDYDPSDGRLTVRDCVASVPVACGHDVQCSMVSAPSVADLWYWADSRAVTLAPVPRVLQVVRECVDSGLTWMTRDELESRSPTPLQLLPDKWLSFAVALMGEYPTFSSVQRFSAWVGTGLACVAPDRVDFCLMSKYAGLEWIGAVDRWKDGVLLTLPMDYEVVDRRGACAMVVETWECDVLLAPGVRVLGKHGTTSVVRNAQLVRTEGRAVCLLRPFNFKVSAYVLVPMGFGNGMRKDCLHVGTNKMIECDLDLGCLA